MNEKYKKLLNNKTNNQMRKIISEYWSGYDVRRFTIPFERFDKDGNSKTVSISADMLASLIEIDYKIECYYEILYNDKKVLFFMKGGTKLMKSYTIEIPYMFRSNYLNFVHEINNLVDVNGVVSFFADNTPTQLRFYLVIETNINSEEIYSLISKNNLSICTEKGYNELCNEMIDYRRYNSFVLSKGMSISEVQFAFEYVCLMPEQKDFEEKGYVFDKQFCKPKIFISYSYGDKKIVYNLIDEFKAYGLNVWIDTEEILPGDNILAKIQNGIKDCDLSIIFLSQNTLKGNFAQFELNSFFNNLIKKSKPWFLIKLDNVNPDDIFEGLSNYNYYDLSENTSSEDLIKYIKKKIKSIQK